MLFHTLESGSLTVLAISQLAHARVTGELATAWRETPEPEVVLGALQHDIGWTAWEGAPTLDSERRRPFDFRRIPTADHVEIWSSASTLALAHGRIPGLLTSMHGTRLYANHDYDRDTPEVAQAARDFVTREEALQHRLRTSIAADASLAAFTTERLAVASHQIHGWDRLSLALCHGVHESLEIPDVTLGDERVTLRLTPSDDGTRVSPWPFSTDSWSTIVDGRLLDRELRTDADLRDWLANADWRQVMLRALPG